MSYAYWCSDEEETEYLRQSMLSSPIRTDKEAARRFLSQLSMYDKDGQLIPEDRINMENYSDRNTK